MSICVTGGTSGIGLAIAERFARSGTEVIVNYHADEEAAAEAERRIADAGGKPFVIKADVGDPEGVARLFEKVSSAVDRLDQLVHSAVTGAPTQISETPPEEVDREVRVNGTSLVYVVQRALPLLGKGSSVFFITSAGSWKVIPGYGLLGAPKALAEHLVRNLAVELAPRGIRINAISPGPLDTAARRKLYPDTWKERLEAQNAQNPSGRGLEFEDVSGVVELMARPEFAMTQGQVLTIDGGLSLL